MAKLDGYIKQYKARTEAEQAEKQREKQRDAEKQKEAERQRLFDDELSCGSSSMMDSGIGTDEKIVQTDIDLLIPLLQDYVGLLRLGVRVTLVTLSYLDNLGNTW